MPVNSSRDLSVYQLAPSRQLSPTPNSRVSAQRSFLSASSSYSMPFKTRTHYGREFPSPTILSSLTIRPAVAIAAFASVPTYEGFLNTTS